MFSGGPMEYVSKCCGGKYIMGVVRAITYASGEIVELQRPGPPLEKTPVCCGCREPCGIALKGEEMKPTEGGIYCQACARKMSRSNRIPEGFVLRYPIPDGCRGTCWGCGETIEPDVGSELVKKE